MSPALLQDNETIIIFLEELKSVAGGWVSPQHAPTAQIQAENPCLRHLRTGFNLLIPF